MNNAPGEGSIAQPVGQQSGALPLYYGCLHTLGERVAVAQKGGELVCVCVSGCNCVCACVCGWSPNTIDSLPQYCVTEKHSINVSISSIHQVQI